MAKIRIYIVLIFLIKYMVTGANGRPGAHVASRVAWDSRGATEVVLCPTPDLLETRALVMLTKTECVSYSHVQVKFYNCKMMLHLWRSLYKHPNLPCSDLP